MEELECDYLVIGAGTASLAFVDTLITYSHNATVIIVDRNASPGGHWVHAYPFVRLHQQGCSYGVNSRTLGTLRGKKQIEVYDMNDRATGKEICEYYDQVVKSFIATKRVKVFFNSEYSCEEGSHTIASKDGQAFKVACGKLVNCLTKVEVPSMRKAPFPVHECVCMKPINDLPKAVKSGTFDKYVVIGAGKTGSDAIMHLLENNVSPEFITWIVSRDVWYLLRDGWMPKSRPKGEFWKITLNTIFGPIIAASSVKESFLNLEKAGSVGRLDPNGPFPKVFKGPTITKGDLDMLRTVKNVIKLGRVTSITLDEIVLESGRTIISHKDTFVVDCMAENIYGYLDFEPDFQTFKPNLIELGPPAFLLNPSLTSTLIGYLEATFHDDSVKNSFIYHLPKQKHECLLTAFIIGVYTHLKTHEQVAKYKPLEKFIIESRTNPDGFGRHGGVFPLLWAAFGPLQLSTKIEALAKKFTNKGFSDVEDPFPGRKGVDPSTLKSALRIDGRVKKGCCSSN